MSTVPLTTSFRTICRAELIRVKGSALMWLPLLGIPLAGISALLGVAAGVTDATGLLWWQGMYLTGMAAPLLGVFAAVVETRERHARFGGVQTRPLPPRHVRAGRLFGVLVAVAVFHLLNFLGTWLAGAGVGGGASTQVLTVGVLAYLGSLGTVALGMVLARLTGITWTVIMLGSWQLAGTLAAEASWWWAFPPTWPIRLVLPALGLHANMIPLAAENPLLSEEPWLALALCLLFAGATGTAAVKLPGKITISSGGRQNAGTKDRVRLAEQPTGARSIPPAVGPQRRRKASTWSVLRALFLVFRRCSIPAIMVVTTAVLVLTACVYPPSYVHGLVVFVVLPLGTAVLPMLTWRLLDQTWRLLVTENPRVRAGLVVWHLLVLAVMCVVAAMAGLAAGGGIADELLRLLLAMVVGGVLVILALSLVVRFSLAVAACAGVVWAVVSATLGGDVLADTWLWVMALPAWPETADSPVRAMTAVVLGLGLFGIGIAALLGALQFHERRN